MKFTLTIIKAPDMDKENVRKRHTKIVIEGREKESRFYTLDDIRRALQAEEFLEKLLGHRFHLDCVEEEGERLREDKGVIGGGESSQTITKDA